MVSEAPSATPERPHVHVQAGEELWQVSAGILHLPLLDQQQRKKVIHTEQIQSTSSCLLPLVCRWRRLGRCCRRKRRFCRLLFPTRRERRGRGSSGGRERSRPCEVSSTQISPFSLMFFHTALNTVREVERRL